MITLPWASENSLVPVTFLSNASSRNGSTNCLIAPSVSTMTSYQIYRSAPRCAEDFPSVRLARITPSIFPTGLSLIRLILVPRAHLILTATQITTTTRRLGVELVFCQSRESKSVTALQHRGRAFKELPFLTFARWFNLLIWRSLAIPIYCK